ncbi:pirin family protein [Aliiroseovarius sp. 2305UL8-7]|uniref:pirin family protein n=1 Tax=Aliiroseovarius conchicola TaxID=3121637 RepID=UPI003527F05A
MKRIVATSTARPEKLGALNIVRALPNSQTSGVGPIIFLDHISETKLVAGQMPPPNGSFAHPHKGIATFSYLLKGEVVHFDSNGGHGTVKAGGVQWMNAGNGIVHDEGMPKSLREQGGDFHAFQFWVNLPAKNKAEAPGYMPLQAEDLPVIPLDGDVGTLKVLLGEFAGRTSPIPAFTDQFIWHINLKPGASLSLPTTDGNEYGGYLPEGRAVISQTEVAAREFFAFGSDDSGIVIHNPTSDAIDVMIFGGEPYREPVVSHGPFVMNTEDEIHQAYADFRAGKYGTIDYHGQSV